MAAQTKLKPISVLVRISSTERDKLWTILFSRYPDKEWGAFFRFGWRESSSGLILTINAIDPPEKGDLDEDSEITVFLSQYTRKIIRLTETHPFGVGVVHSHPEGFFTTPSLSDDDMELYYSQLLQGYTPDRPFLSLIFSKEGGQFSGSGRIWWKNRWLNVERFAIERCPVLLYNFKKTFRLSGSALKRVARLASQLSTESAEALAQSTVGVVGASGTGSPIIELLARAGIGKLIVVDPKVFEDSNFERNHCSTIADIGTNIPKALLAKRYVKSINPDCEVIAIEGRLPQNQVLDELLMADIVLGCTDQHSARAALSDLSTRYLVPVIDVGVAMEGEAGVLTGQAIQVNRLFPGDACVHCRKMVSVRIIAQELMNEEERNQRQTQATKAKLAGGNPDAYWINVPQLNTVGYLTTIAGGIVAGFCVGYLTGRFDMPKNRLEFNLGIMGTTVVERDERANESCVCQTSRGNSDQDSTAITISAPSHWAPPVFFS